MKNRNQQSRSQSTSYNAGTWPLDPTELNSLRPAMMTDGGDKGDC